jgi:hypothetical protein
LVKIVVVSILRNHNTVLTVSSLTNDYHGISDVCLSLAKLPDDDILFVMAYAEDALSKQKLTTVASGNALWRKVELWLG